MLPGLLLLLFFSAAPVGEQTRERRKKRTKRKVETDGKEPTPLTPHATITIAISTVRWHGQWK
jgi:hypothetical protein